MGRVQFFITCSLGGFIARSDGEGDWLFTDSERGSLLIHLPLFRNPSGESCRAF